MKIRKKLLKEIILNEADNIATNIIDKFLNVLVKWDTKKIINDPRFKDLQKDQQSIDSIKDSIEDMQPKIKELKAWLNDEGPYGESNLKYIYDYVKKLK